MLFCILKNSGCKKSICCNICKTKKCGDRCYEKCSKVEDCKWAEEREPKEDEIIE